MLPPRNVLAEELEQMSKEDLEGVALSFPDSSSAGNTNTGSQKIVNSWFIILDSMGREIKCSAVKRSAVWGKKSVGRTF